MNWSGTWHPLAERFPMLSEDELREMADSIAERGQYVPCRMTPDGLGLDGRNRTAACALAGIEPIWEVYEGDPVPFIVEVNAERRHLTTGQRAMAVAIGLGADARKNGKWKRGTVPPPVDHERDAWRVAAWKAGLVLDHAPDLADPVLSGEMALDAAHREAMTRRDRETRLAELDEQLAGLVQAGVIDLDDAEARVRDEARIAELPEDLAARVRGGTLSVDEAETIAEQNRQRMDAHATAVVDALDRLQRMAGYPISDGITERLDDEHNALLRAVVAAIPPRRDAT